MDKAPLFTAAQCQAQIARLAVQILEANWEQPSLCLLGIEGQGAALARMLADEISRRQADKVSVGTLRLPKHAGTMPQVELHGLATDQLPGSVVVLVDDVLNTGQTLAYAFTWLMGHSPATVQVGVLVGRDHRRYPIAPDFVGHRVSTTLEEHIEVVLGQGVYLT